MASAGRYKKRQPKTALGSCIDAYNEYAKVSGSLAAATIRGTVSNTRSLVFELEDAGHCSFEGVTLLDISNTLTKMTALRATGGISGFFGDIRRFLKFLYHNDLSKLDLSIAIPEYVTMHRSFGYGLVRKKLWLLLILPIQKRHWARETLQ